MPRINGKYYTDSDLREIKRELNDDDAFNSFLVSGIVSAVTGSALLGLLSGGSIVGALLGDELSDDDWF